MNWGSKEECHCPSTVWGVKNFWPNCQISRSKTSYGINRFWRGSKEEYQKNFWPRWYTKKVIRCQISRAKTSYMLFQHKSLSNLVKDLFKWIEGLRRSVTVRLQSEGQRIFDLGGIRKKYSNELRVVVKFRAQKLAIWCFNINRFWTRTSQNWGKEFLFKWIEGLRRIVTVRVQSEGKRIFDLGGIRKKYSIRCQISRSKTSYKCFNINRFST